MRVIVALILLASLAACAGEPAAPVLPTEPEPIVQNDPPTEPPLPEPTSRRPTVAPERLTELPSLRELATIPTFTPTFTPTITLTPTATFTPSPTFTPTPLQPEEYCEVLSVSTQFAPDTVYRDSPVILQMYMPIADVALRFTIVHVETGETVGSVDIPGGENIMGTFEPTDFPYSGRYDYRVTVVNAAGDDQCTIESYFIIELPEVTAEATAELTPEVTLELTVELTAERTPEMTAEELTPEITEESP